MTQYLCNSITSPVSSFFAPGAPQALLQSCLTFGAFSCIIEGLNKQQPALALPFSAGNGSIGGRQDVLPPFTLPLPRDIMEGVSSFCKSLPKSKRASHEWLVTENLVYYHFWIGSFCWIPVSKFRDFGFLLVAIVHEIGLCTVLLQHGWFVHCVFFIANSCEVLWIHGCNLWRDVKLWLRSGRLCFKTFINKI